MTDLVKQNPAPIQKFGDDIEPVSRAAMVKALALNDYSRLTPEERLMWVGALAKSTGANPLVKIVEWLTFQGKLQPYATKAFAEQMRLVHNVSIRIKSRRREEGCVIVEVEARTPDGRVDESMAAIPLSTSDIGEKFAMACMKAETKAKRRVTLSLTGLGFMDGGELTPGEQPASAAEPTLGTPSATELNAIIADPAKPETVAQAVEQPPPPPRSTDQDGASDRPERPRFANVVPETIPADVADEMERRVRVACGGNAGRIAKFLGLARAESFRSITGANYPVAVAALEKAEKAAQKPAPAPVDEPPPPVDEADSVPPDEPTAAPECPTDPAAWLKAMNGVLTAKGMEAEEVKTWLAKEYKTCGKASYLGLTQPQRERVWRDANL